MFTLFARVSGFKTSLPQNVVLLTQYLDTDIPVRGHLLGYKNEIDQGIGVPLQVQLKTLQNAVSATDHVHGIGITSIVDWDGVSPVETSYLSETVRVVDGCEINVTLRRPFEHGLWVWFNPVGDASEKAFFAYGNTLCTWFTSHVARTEIAFRKMYSIFESSNELAGYIREHRELLQPPLEAPTLAAIRSVSEFRQGLLDDLRQSPELLGSPKVRSAAS